jgi:hypothetical protein
MSNTVRSRHRKEACEAPGSKIERRSRPKLTCKTPSVCASDSQLGRNTIDPAVGPTVSVFAFAASIAVSLSRFTSTQVHCHTEGWCLVPQTGRLMVVQESDANPALIIPASLDYLAQHGRLATQTSSSFPTHSTTCTSCQHMFVPLPAHDTLSCMRAQSSTRVIQKIF